VSNERATGEARPRSRYHAHHVSVNRGVDLQEQLRCVLDAAEAREWHLVGVAGGLPDGGMVVFWDTERATFGRTSW
jgi:hypothetical protein